MDMDYCGIPACSWLVLAPLRTVSWHLTELPHFLLVWLAQTLEARQARQAGQCSYFWHRLSLQLLSVTKKEEWQHRAVQCHAQGDALRPCKRSPSTTIWVVSERRQKTSQSCVILDSETEQARQRQPRSGAAAAALTYRRIRMSLWPCRPLF